MEREDLLILYVSVWKIQNFLRKLSTITHKINQDFVTPTPTFFVEVIN